MQFKLDDMPKDVKPFRILPWGDIENLKAMPVQTKEGAQEAYRRIGWRMVATCLAEDGIGLAGPQICIFRSFILIRDFNQLKSEEYEFLPSFKLYINPTWEGNQAKGKTTLDEWCLSVPGKKGYPIRRYKEINATWFEFENNELIKKSKVMNDFPARILQHEVDHLRGISIPQRWEIQNKKQKKVKKHRKK